MKLKRRLRLMEKMGAKPRCGRVVVGYPVGGSVTLPFHESILRLLKYEILKPDHKRLLARVWHVSGLYVADNRQVLVERFIDEHTYAEWLLQIDTDIAFPENILETMTAMAGDDKKILGASVPLGSYSTCGFNRGLDPEKSWNWKDLASIPTNKPIKVDGLATTCILVHRSVFEDIAMKHGRSWFQHIYLPKKPGQEPGSGFAYDSIGEDLAFCLRASQVGHQSWVVHIPGLRHHKTRALSHDDERTAELAADDGAAGELVAEG